MKKILIALAMVAMFAMMFTGCSKIGDCAMCGKKDVNVRDIEAQGEVASFCDDCYDAAEALAKVANAMG